MFKPFSLQSALIGLTVADTSVTRTILFFVLCDTEFFVFLSFSLFARPSKGLKSDKSLSEQYILKNQQMKKTLVSE